MYYQFIYDHSKIIRSEIIDRKETTLRSLPYYIFEMIFATVIIVTNIINKIILNPGVIFDPIFVTIVLYCVSSGIYACVRNDIFALNHPGVARLIKFIKDAAKLSLNGVSLAYYYGLLRDFHETNSPGVSTMTGEQMRNEFFQFFTKYPIKGFMLVFTVIMTLVLTIEFVIIQFKYLIPPFNLIMFYRFLRSNDRLFVQYVYYDKKRVIINYRYYDEDDYIVKNIHHKLKFIGIIIVTILILSLLGFITISKVR